MTAVIAILNKSGAAIAADSAVTVSNMTGRKIYNSANKIFTLSKYHPISIMIYNSASLMTTPWEVIIKTYRNQLKDKKFPSIKHYQNDFLQYLQKNNYFTDTETQKKNFKNNVHYTFQTILKRTNFNPSIFTKDSVKEHEPKIFDEIKSLHTYCAKNKKSDLYNDYTLDKFLLFGKDIIDDCARLSFPQFDYSKWLTTIYELFHYYFLSTDFSFNYSGLVFTGFGDKEIYPSCIQLRIGEVYDNKVRYIIEKVEVISDNCRASIIPFAQRDVIDTIISGIHPGLNDAYIKIFHKFLSKYTDSIKVALKGIPQDKVDLIDQINYDKIVDELIKQVETFKKTKYITPTLETVALLSKEDLSEMAESLIYLTYLKRRITSDEESVGGPVDVAVISKGDGFIWKKRKLYFNPELNQHFFDNYFRH